MSSFSKSCQLLAVAAICAAASAQAITVSKNSGATTPNLSDFPAAVANHPSKAGYNAAAVNKMFIETFRAQCSQGQKVTLAQFSITVKNLGELNKNDSLSFWDNQVSPFSQRIWTGGESVGTTKTLSFNMASLPPVGGLILNNNGSGLAILGDGDFSFAVQDDTSVLSASLEYQCEGGAKKGLTFGQYPKHAVSGIATAACQGQPGPDCNPYQGDQLCTTALPVLCMRSLGLPNPASNTADPQHWSGGVIATTPDIAPTAANLHNKSQVDAYCAAQFGAGWVVSDFHAGTGWKFGAYGNVGQSNKRAWVNVKDQANGNCWSQ